MCYLPEELPGSSEAQICILSVLEAGSTTSSQPGGIFHLPVHHWFLEKACSGAFDLLPGLSLCHVTFSRSLQSLSFKV